MKYNSFHIIQTLQLKIIEKVKTKFGWTTLFLSLSMNENFSDNKFQKKISNEDNFKKTELLFQ